jgi:hypothetical protein
MQHYLMNINCVKFFVKSEIITNNEGNVKQLQNKYSNVNESIVSKID